MIRVVATEGGGAGRSHDLTASIEGLQWSNVRPGGDEIAGFTYKRPWGTNLPEIAKGNLLRIEYGIDVVWQGRIEELDRGGSEAEEIAVTAYGLGNRLKDGSLPVIYVDRNLGNWIQTSNARRLAIYALGLNIGSWAVEPDDSGAQALALDASGRFSSGISTDAWYDAGSAILGFADYGWTAENTNASAWVGRLDGSDDDALSSATTGTDQLDDADTSGSITGETSIADVQFANLKLFLLSASSTDTERKWSVKNLALFGNHGATIRGSYPNRGYYASDIVRHVLSDLDNVEERRVDDTSTVILQAEHRDGPTHQEIIEAATRIHAHERTWGTWGPDSPLAESTAYFDWIEPADEPEWSARRESFENLDLHTEISTLFDTVIVKYTDASGKAQTVTRTTSVPDLEAAGLSGRTYTLNGGSLSTGAAETLGDTFLALSGGFAPARGSATIARPIRHATRGAISPAYLRADGAAIRIPDILPSNTLFALDDTPDRRTAFPIRRVRVDAGGPYLKATLELDQTNDFLTALQARLDAAAEVAL